MIGQYDDPNYCPLDEELGEPATFHFPHQCCRCLAPSPARTWKIANWKKVEGTDVTVHSHVDVPVCGNCWSELRRTHFMMAAVTWSLAIAVGIALWFFDPFDSRNAELKDAFMIWSVTAIFAAPVFIGIYFAIDGMVVPRQMQTVAYLNRDGDEIRFFNVEYQRMFEGYYPPAAAPDSYAPADEEPVRW